MSGPRENAITGTKLLTGMLLGSLLLLLLVDVLLGWRRNSVFERAVDLVILLGFTLMALDSIQRKIAVSRDSLRIRYLFHWRTYPIPETAEIQDWGHSVGFVDRVTFQPLFIFPKSSVGGDRGLKEIQAARDKAHS